MPSAVISEGHGRLPLQASEGTQEGTLASRREGGFEAGELHATPRFRILHEGIPHEPAPQVLRHQHGDAGVNADDIGIEPFGKQVECIDESILGPGLITVTKSDIAKDRYGGRRRRFAR